MNTTTELETIWHDFAAPLHGFIRKRIANEHDAEDILHQVFVKIQTRLGSLRETEKLQGWLYRIARNAIVDHYRSQRPLPTLLPADAEPSRCELEVRASIATLIEELDPKYREAIRLHEYEGLTQAQIAKRLHISLSGVKSRVQRGREQLKQLLLECCRFKTDRYGNIVDCEDDCACEHCD
jgi:RNA polymerase sigma-70 factor (ECF subfamily)